MIRRPTCSSSQSCATTPALRILPPARRAAAAQRTPLAASAPSSFTSRGWNRQGLNRGKYVVVTGAPDGVQSPVHSHQDQLGPWRRQRRQPGAGVGGRVVDVHAAQEL